MTATLVHGDHVSCSRVGGGMRRESSRLRQHAQSLEDAIGELAVWKGSEADAARPAMVASLAALRATADVLDEAGAALQRYATDLAEGHELGRRAERRVHSAGLILDGTRVIEPWGPASAQESERRCSEVPGVQARVDLATAHVGRARGRLGRQMTSLSQAFGRPPTTP
jgi:hypothetical protein